MIIECPYCQASHSKGNAELGDSLEIRCRSCGRPFWADVEGTYKERPLAPPTPPSMAGGSPEGLGDGDGGDDDGEDSDDPFLGAPTSVMRAPPSAVIEQLTREALETADLAQTGFPDSDSFEDLIGGPTTELLPAPEPMESETTHPSANRGSGIVPIPSGLDPQSTTELSIDGLMEQLDAMRVDAESDSATDPGVLPPIALREERPPNQAAMLSEPTAAERPAAERSDAQLPVRQRTAAEPESMNGGATEVAAVPASLTSPGGLDQLPTIDGDATRPGSFGAEKTSDDAPAVARPFEEFTAVASSEDFKRAIEASRRSTMEVSDADIIFESSAPVPDPRQEEPQPPSEVPVEYVPEPTLDDAPSLDSLPDAFTPDPQMEGESPDGAGSLDPASTAFKRRTPQLPRFPSQELKRWGEAQWRWIRGQNWQVQSAIFGGAGGLLLLLLIVLSVALSDENRTRYLSNPQALRPLPDPEAALPNTQMLMRGAEVVALEELGEFALVRDLAGNTGYLRAILLSEDLPVAMPEYTFADCYQGFLEEGDDECRSRAQIRHNSCRGVCGARPQEAACLERCQLRLNDCTALCEGGRPPRPPGPMLEEPNSSEEIFDVESETGDPRGIVKKKKRKRKKRF